jgi:hypothetical protein
MWGTAGMLNPSPPLARHAHKRRRVDCLSSQTARTLLHHVGTGSSRIRSTVSVAGSMVADGLRAPDIVDLASCGARHAQNEERDLLRWCAPYLSGERETGRGRGRGRGGTRERGTESEGQRERGDRERQRERERERESGREEEGSARGWACPAIAVHGVAASGEAAHELEQLLVPELLSERERGGGDGGTRDGAGASKGTACAEPYMVRLQV